MATIRDMLNANGVMTKLAVNPNVYVTTSFKLLPILEFLTEVAENYANTKKDIIASDTSVEEKEILLNTHLDSNIDIPEVKVGINTLRNCNLTMIDIKNLNWWLVAFEDEFEDE